MLKQTIKLPKCIVFALRDKTVRQAARVLSLVIAVGLVIGVDLQPHAKIIGPVEVVFDWSEDACEREDIPDVPARAFRDAQGRVQLISSHYINRRMVGPDLHNLEHDCSVIMASHYNPNPANFNDREWIHSVYTQDGTTVFALVHNEYQGNTHPGQCPSGEYFACWYNSVTLAISTDGGASYTHAPPTLVASIPYRYKPDSGQTGIFNPSNIIYNSRDGYFYVLFHTTHYGAQAWGTSVMRTKDLADPASWRAWDGWGFNVRFINPYHSPEASPQHHVARPVASNEIQGMGSSLTFNTYLKRFVLVGMAHGYNPESRQRVWGFFYSLSDDLIHWTPRKLILQAKRPATFVPGDAADPFAYPSLLDPDSTSRNFETTGKQAYLYFTRFNYTSGEHAFDRDLVRVPIEFFK